MIKLITFTPFGTNKLDMLNVVNHGILKDDSLHYKTIDGNKHELIKEITTNQVNVIDIEQINIKDSLYHWFKDKKESKDDKTFIYNEKLEIGETYKGRCWRYSVLLHLDNNVINWKINLE